MGRRQAHRPARARRPGRSAGTGQPFAFHRPRFSDLPQVPHLRGRARVGTFAPLVEVGRLRPSRADGGKVGPVALAVSEPPRIVGPAGWVGESCRRWISST